MPGDVYDVFLSYHTKDPVGYWVRQFFATELSNWLDQQFPERASQVFFDRTDIYSGDKIADKLLDALERSRVFVPVLSTSYFSQSLWCKWEWQCFRKLREDGIMPVLYYKKELLPIEAQELHMADFSRYNQAFPAFPKTEPYGAFQALVMDFAQQVATKISTMPAIPPGRPPGFTPPSPPARQNMPVRPQITQRRMIDQPDAR
jgi:hypothetical protein